MILKYLWFILEYEGCLILLDLALQTPAAFRHVLVNAVNTKLVLKLVFITLIIDGYIKWSHGNSKEEEGLFLDQEYNFYTQVKTKNILKVKTR